MFEFVEDESALTFETKVSVQHPKVGKQQFTAEFLVVESDELVNLSINDKELLEKVFVGFSGVRDANKEMIEFNPEIKKSMINRPYVRTALVAKYMNDIQGFKRGN